ncbi:DUF5392 family protein [Pontibacillus litoralis]|uniref:Uncharacterized protein n=1 Tax=Pontibacillus litoralis JSM 072002 TaxID=1385512 RepID=A0A0A5G372_9BACI|nr:DUF5392 family protein [Pontibacillus litoralis]KGX85583.1 hypothetical protein N784_08725 [Pontibacillus litoralis JSM 072002]
MNFMNLPKYMEIELEKMNETIQPLLKKVSKYTFGSVLLISFAIFNLISVMFYGESTPTTLSLIILAFVGAFGMALNKEKKVYKQEINQKGNEYIMGRMKNSRTLSEQRIDHYIKDVKQQNTLALNLFYSFLTEEEEVKNKALYG